MLKNPTFLELTPQTGYNGKVLPKLIKCTSALKLQLSIAIINSEGCIYLFWKNLNCQNFLFLIIFVSINLTKNKKLALRISRFLKTILTKSSSYLNQGLLTHLWYLHFSKKNFHSPQPKPWPISKYSRSLEFTTTFLDFHTTYEDEKIILTNKSLCKHNLRSVYDIFSSLNQQMKMLHVQMYSYFFLILPTIYICK